jgi:hypothetical protein
MNASRVRRKGKGEIPGIVSGLSILYCGYCGSAVVGQNLMGRNRKPDGSPQDGHRRLICCGHNLGESCAVGGSCSVVPVEKAILSFCSDQFNLSSLINRGNQTSNLMTRLAGIRKQKIELERQLARVADALLAAEESTPLVFVRKARELEAKIAEESDREKVTEAELRGVDSHRAPAVSSAWAKLVTGALSLDYEARMRTRQLVADTFERIVIYHRGMSPDNNNEKHIDLLLIAKGGKPRLLRIDRKTGEWQAGEDFLVEPTN